MSAIEDLVQCPICFERLNTPKMLPCQHTFCLGCLKLKDGKLTCPFCQREYPTDNPKFVESLPTNLYIDNLLSLLESPSNEYEEPDVISVNAKICQKRCCNCQSIVEISKEYHCQHCKKTYCGVCWSAHVMELKSQIGSLINQLDACSQRLGYKMTNFRDHNEWLINQIKSTAAVKIREIEEKQQKLLSEAAELLKNGETSSDTLEELISATKKNVLEYTSNEFDHKTGDEEKVSAFMNFHKLTVNLLNDVSKWNEEKYSFDRENFCIGKNTVVANLIETDEPVKIDGKKINNPLESEQSMAIFYRSKVFAAKKIWRKCPRPAGIGIPPWSEYLYICATDSRDIIVLDRSKLKIVNRISHSDILYPVSIAFSERLGLIYVSDKWKHCIHVLNKNGTYMKSIGSKGKKEGTLMSPEGISIDPKETHIYVCDTGNDRIQVFNMDTGAFSRYIGIYSKSDDSTMYTQLNAPTSIATIHNKIIVADSGNRRIKIYSYNGEKLREFGSQGYMKGQFQHPETIAVDPLGFIIVGDSGNARVQIFEPNGQLLRVFGGKGEFGWISGMHISPQLDLIVCDTKNHQINIY